MDNKDQPATFKNIETLPEPDVKRATSTDSEHLDRQKMGLSGFPSPTKYEFIMESGDKNATTRQKLKTVRSHVMKNFIHQQHQREQTREPSLSAQPERRRSKQRVRRNRSVSASLDANQSATSPTMSETSHSTTTGVGASNFDFLFSCPFLDRESDRSTNLGCHSQQFALDFSFEPPRDEIADCAQAYLNSVIEDRHFGREELSFKTLQNKGETFRMIKEMLGSCNEHVPFSLIFAVNILAFGCATENSWDEVRGHLDAFRFLIDVHGGLETADFELQRALTWTSYCLCGFLQLPPILPPPLFGYVDAFPLAFLDDAQMRAWRTVKRFPKGSSFVYDSVLRLHQLSLAISSDWYYEVDQHALSNLYFESAHHVLSLPYEEPWNATLTNESQRQEHTLMFKVWATGLPLFLGATSRHARAHHGLVVTRSNQEPLYSRVKDLLEGKGEHLTWPRGKYLEPVLATLFYCAEACGSADPWRPWFLKNIERVVQILKLKTIKEFKKTLEYFPLSDEHQATADHLWMEIVHGTNFAYTPTLIFSTSQ